MANYKSSYTGAQIDAGIAKANTAIQEHQDISGKVDKVDGKGLSSNDFTNEEKAKLDNIDMSEKQDTLVSGTNIKTINNTSILGSGNINIEGGGSSTDVQINGTSITYSGEANIVTEGTYNASTNKIATIDDIPNPSLTPTAIYLLLQILEEGIYGTDQTSNISALSDALYGQLPGTYFSVTNNLTNVSTDNDDTQVAMGDSYSATLSLADPSYALSTISVIMGGINVTSTAYDDTNMKITIPEVIGDIVITASATNRTLDSLAYKNLTYRDIFITGNQLSDYDFENGVPSSANVNAGTPTLSTEEYCSPTHSIKLFGTSSQQYNDSKQITIAAGHTVFAACKLNCSRYVAGYIGWSNSLIMPTGITGTTNGWETKYRYRTVNNTNIETLQFWGTYTSANIDCYMDDFVCIDIDDVCGEAIPEQTMLRLYNEYIQIRESEGE